MKKRVLATILTVCFLFSAMACVASAASNVSVGEIDLFKRICPGDIIDTEIMEIPEVRGYARSQGWEIKSIDGYWIPYDGEPLPEKPDAFGLRYYAVDYDGNYAYSNECEVKVAHNPSGSYEYSGLEHWRVCDDCGGQADLGGHDHLGSDAKAESKVCSVCGHVRTSQYTGILAFIEWLMALVASLF